MSSPSLLGIPAELRIHIYGFVYPTTLDSPATTVKLSEIHTIKPSKALVLTSRQLHNETAAMYQACHRLWRSFWQTARFEVDVLDGKKSAAGVVLTLGPDVLHATNWRNRFVLPTPKPHFPDIDDFGLLNYILPRNIQPENELDRSADWVFKLGGFQNTFIAVAHNGLACYFQKDASQQIKFTREPLTVTRYSESITYSGAGYASISWPSLERTEYFCGGVARRFVRAFAADELRKRVDEYSRRLDKHSRRLEDREREEERRKARIVGVTSKMGEELGRY